MKQFHSLLLFLILTFSLSATGVLGEDRYINLDTGIDLYIYDGKGYYYNHLEEKPKGFPAIIEEKDVKLDRYGYLNIKLYDENMLFINGGGYGELFNPKYLKGQPLQKMVKDSKGQKAKLEGGEYYTLSIESIKASSHLAEKVKDGTIEFGAENLLTCYYDGGCICHPKYWNSNSLPWSEGEKGDGIGVTLDISFSKPQAGFVILNGYVNPAKPQLFKENNRLKRIKVSSLDKDGQFELFYNFKDRVEFSRIILPKKVSKVRIELVDVYKGSKWSDTCISAILPDLTKEYDSKEIKKSVDNLLLSLQ